MWFRNELLFFFFAFTASYAILGTSFKWWENVFLYRILASIALLLLLQELSVQAFMFLFQIISWHPAAGAQNWFRSLYSWTSVLCHMFLGLLALIFAVLHTRHYSVEPRVSLTRLEVFWGFCHPRRLLHQLLLSCSGGLVVYCYLGLLGGEISEFMVKCVGDCQNGKLNGQHIFVIFHGIYAGFLFSYQYFSKDMYLLKFPHVQQMTFLTIKSKAVELLINSAFEVIKNLRWFYTIFFLFGSYVKNWLATVLGLTNSANASMSFNELFDLNLLLITVGAGTVLYFMWNLYICIFNAFAIERYTFVLQSSLEANTNKTLSKSLTCSNFKLFQYLAISDLRFLAQNSASRRQQIFSISQPGGHPYEWEAISNICVSSIEDFMLKLNQLLITDVQKPASFQMTAVSESYSSISSPLTYMHPMSYMPSEKLYISSKIRSSPPTRKNPDFNSYFTTMLKKFQECIRRKPVIAYFLDDLPDAKAKKLFNSCQPVIWIAEALSFLVSASYKEDRYGVVQQSLPRILCLFLELKICEEKLPAGTIAVRKYGRDYGAHRKDALLRHSLKSAVDSAIYRIVITFKKHIGGIHLPEDYMRHLKRYLDYKE